MPRVRTTMPYCSVLLHTRLIYRLMRYFGQAADAGLKECNPRSISRVCRDGSPGRGDGLHLLAT